MIFCKMATNDDQVCAYLKQEIHDRLHNHSLFASLESFKIWPCELENRTRILSPERAARRHFGEKQWNVPTRQVVIFWRKEKKILSRSLSLL